MEQSLSYEDKKLYFFHELTHALQTSHENGREQCGFFNGHDGMFLTEGATQYTAEMLYNVSNGTTMEHRQQPRTVRGASNRTPYSPLSEYQYNGNVLELLSKSMDLPLPQVLALAYKKDGRETLKDIYESMEGNQGKFDSFMNELEQLYSIDNLLIHGYAQQLQSQTPLNITMQDRVTVFQGDLDTYRELMNKTERELVATYMENHDTEYILQNYEEVAELLTTPELKNNFLSAVHVLGQDLSQSNRGNIKNFEEHRINTQPQANETQQVEQYNQQNENKLTIRQRIAQFLQKNDMLMNIPFVEKFVDKQLNVLPPCNTRNTSTQTVNRTRESFINELTNFGAYRNLPPIQRMSDPKRIARMQRKMEENQQSNDDNERG